MALSKPRNTKQRLGEPLPPKDDQPVKANVKLWQGALVVLDAGFLAPGRTATGLIGIGMSEATVDNTGGAAGAVRAAFKPGCFRWANSANADAIAQADVGQLCYVVDDQTVAKTDGGGTRSIAGTIAGVDAQGVYVQMGLVPGVDGTALAAEIAARQGVSSDLASTANGKGASLVGLEDAAGLFAGATVEAGMAEKLTGLRTANVADSNVIGGLEVVHIVPVPDAATGNVDVVLTHKTEIMDVEVVKQVAAGGASDTIQLKNGAAAITDAMSINVADQTVVRPTTIDDAATVIAAGGTLRVARTKASAANVACRVIVRGVRRA